MNAGEVAARVEIVDRGLDQVGELDQRVIPLLAAARVFGEQNRVLGLDQKRGRHFDLLGIRRHLGRHLDRRGRRQGNLAVQVLFLQPGVVTHVNGPLGIGHHDRIGAREGFRHAVHGGRLSIEFHVFADRRALAVGGMNPVDLGPPLGLVERPRGTDDEDRRAVDIGVVDRHVGMEKAHQVMDDGDHRLAGCAGIAVGDLHRRFLMGTQQHMGIITAVIDHRIVQPPVAGPRIEGGKRQIVHMHHVDDDVGVESPRAGALHPWFLGNRYGLPKRLLAPLHGTRSYGRRHCVPPLHFSVVRSSPSERNRPSLPMFMPLLIFRRAPYGALVWPPRSRRPWQAHCGRASPNTQGI